VATAQETEKVIIKGLDTHAYAVYSRYTQSGYIFCGDVIGITLYCEFLKIIQTVSGADAVYHPPYLRRSETRRGAAPEIDRSDGSAFKVVTAGMEFRAKGVYITYGFCLTNGGEEAAVYTTTGTERNMYVDARQGVRSLS
jgi:hypothetical protein